MPWSLGIPAVTGLTSALILFSSCALVKPPPTGMGSIQEMSMEKNRAYDRGGIIRGDTSRKQIALIFTGGEYGEGSAHILDTLRELSIKASMFVTGDFIRTSEHHPFLRRMVREGHYLGPHSDSHTLYCPWDNREQTLVTEEFFKRDLLKNIEELRAFGALPPGQPLYFIPPYEWYNEDQVKWCKELGITLFNFSPGSGSNRDWAPESDPRFVSSRKILDDILEYEQEDPHGLSGFLLLLHLGAEREDKMFFLLRPLLEDLRRRGYTFVRVDELLESE